MSIRGLSDEEVVEMIIEGFEEDGRVKTDFLEVECVNGRPIISGRVASDEERELIDEILGDVLGIHDYENSVWVDDTLAFEESHGDDRLEVEDKDEEELEPHEPFDEDDEEKNDDE